MKFVSSGENPGPTDGNDAIKNKRDALLPSDDEFAKAISLKRSNCRALWNKHCTNIIAHLY
jgi:hypothetical protein